MKIILKFLKLYYKSCILIVLLMTIDMLGAILIPTLVGKMLDDIVNDKDKQKLILFGVEIAVVSIISALSAIAGGYVSSRLASNVGCDIRKSLYKKTLEMSITDFKNYGVASLTNRSISDINNIQLAILNIFQMVLPVPIVFAITITFAFIIDYMIGLILLGVILIILIIAYFIMKSANPLFKKLQHILDKMSEVILENITGVRIVRAFNKEEYENNRLDSSFNEYKSTSISANRKFASLDSISFIAINVFVVLIYYFSGFRISAGYFSFGEITTVIEYAILALYFLMMAQMIILTLPRAFECASRINEVLEYKVEINSFNDNNYKLDDNNEIIKFDNVSFKFKDAELDSLKNLSFTINKGEMVAIIGSTGSGKSTIASLIMRFLENTSGDIYFKNEKLDNIPDNILKEKISYIPQKAWLFSGTIRENLLVGNCNAKEDDMIKALNDSESKFVFDLEKGLDSRVSQSGSNFSGGQKQRLCIARALLKDSDLYIFDDSFSALDFKTDRNLRHTLKKEYSNKTFLIIAQRITSIVEADKIIVLNNGEMVGFGRHKDLLENCSYYKEIYDSQVKEYNE